jgi:uncharacterized protein (DUF924 family)
MRTYEDVLAFWLDAVGPKGWYLADEALDETIRGRFLPLWEAARDGKLRHWLCTAHGRLAYLIVTDQFPRNMFRGSGEAFSTDHLALKEAILACHHRVDLQVQEPARQFFYMPLMHSENVMDNDRCVRLFLTRMPETGAGNVLHARAHRAVIRKFSRFPYRNDALARKTTKAESAFLNDGGYGSIVRELSAAV